MPNGGESLNAWWPLGSRLVDIISAILIVFLFVIMLMTAIAQQEVVTRLKEGKLTVNYTTALALAREAEVGRADLVKLQQDERRLSAELPRKQSSARLAERNAETAWQKLLPLARRFATAGACPVTLPIDNSPAARAATVGDLNECDSDGGTNLPRASARLLQAAQLEAKAVRQTLDQLASAQNELSALNDFLDSTREQIKSARALTQDQQVAQSSFSDTGVLTSNKLLLGGVLVQFPPAMLQILLTFISGLFGALLLTLILLVYPRNVLDGGASSQTRARTLLGGLIALCVYIVILGSTAVLGSTSGLAAAGTNYMALCAIGILAGMFSDRVAGWLSEQADAFFKRAATKGSHTGQAAGQGK